MKTITTLLFVSLASVILGGTRPEKTPSILHEIQSKAWYQSKAEEWRQFLTNTPEDPSGWVEYFKVSKYGGVAEEILSNISNEITALFPGSFESNYIKSKVVGWTDEGIELLDRSLIDAQKEEFLSDRLMVAEAKNLNRKEISASVFESGMMYPSLLNYSYNVLMSVGENGVLLVQGEPTTLSLWVLQDVMKVREDVRILSTDLALSKSYLENWSTDKNINLPNDLAVSSLGKLPELNPDTEFFFALTQSTEDFQTLEERLYVVGLTSVHKKESFDHYETLKENIESKFLLDYLTVDFSGEPKTATGKAYETNYLVPFLLLKEHYDNVDDNEKAEQWKQQILNIADRSEIKNRVELMLQKQDDRGDIKSFTVIDLPIKTIEKNMVLLKENLYVDVKEVTAKEYWSYLDYLVVNGHDDLFELADQKSKKYDDLTAKLLLPFHYNKSLVLTGGKRHERVEKYYQYPVIDVTFDAANSYCEWLTFQYNQQPNRKYSKVKFRLPKQQEWTMAALGDMDFTSWVLEENTVMASNQGERRNIQEYNLSEYEISFPWWERAFDYRNKIKNLHGCYLANVKTPNEISCPAGVVGDGFSMMSPVGTYFANANGVYDATGNVSEMIEIEGKSMGGSWNHDPEESTITSVNEYEGSDAAVGFRVFMEVLEK